MALGVTKAPYTLPPAQPARQPTSSSITDRRNTSHATNGCIAIFAVVYLVNLAPTPRWQFFTLPSKQLPAVARSAESPKQAAAQRSRSRQRTSLADPKTNTTRHTEVPESYVPLPWMKRMRYLAKEFERTRTQEERSDGMRVRHVDTMGRASGPSIVEDISTS
jgi:hypothetical protein